MSRARTVKGWTVWLQVLPNDISSGEHFLLSGVAVSAELIILPGHALNLPTSAQISHFSLQKSICSEFHEKILRTSN